MGAVLFFLFLSFVFFVMLPVAIVNTLVAMDEEINSSWANVQAQYQRRYDLIPNLVTVVERYAKHEKDTLQAVAEARAKMGSTRIDLSAANQNDLDNFFASQVALSGALGKLLAVVENYPTLKADQQFMRLQEELIDTENKVAKFREGFNSKVKQYNTSVRSVPERFLAKWNGMSPRPYFRAEDNAQRAVSISK